MDNPLLPMTPTPYLPWLWSECFLFHQHYLSRSQFVHIVQWLQKAPALSLLSMVISLSLLSKLSIEVDLLYAGLRGVEERFSCISNSFTSCLAGRSENPFLERCSFSAKPSEVATASNRSKIEPYMVSDRFKKYGYRLYLRTCHVISILCLMD